MKLLWYYWPEPAVSLVGLVSLRYLERAVAGRLPRWLFLAAAAWLLFTLAFGLRAILGVHPPISVMMIRGLAFAFAVCITAMAVILWMARRVNVESLSPSRRKLMRAGFATAMAAPVVLTGYGAVIGRKQFRLVEANLEVRNLPPDLEGLRMVQLTDIHLGPFLSRTDLRWCVDMANETRASIGLITGDLITGSTDPLDDCLDELKRLRCPEGLYGCLGNHERYIEAEPYTVEHGLRRGIRFLRSESAAVTIGQSKLNVVGVDFLRPRERGLMEAARLQSPGTTNLLLCHNPALYPQARSLGWDLMIAGHTHGGQVDLEIWDRHITPVRIATPYVYGKYREGGNTLLYVARGIGTVGVPARIGAPPEVALLRLVRA